MDFDAHDEVGLSYLKTADEFSTNGGPDTESYSQDYTTSKSCIFTDKRYPSGRIRYNTAMLCSLWLFPLERSALHSRLT